MELTIFARLWSTPRAQSSSPPSLCKYRCCCVGEWNLVRLFSRSAGALWPRNLQRGLLLSMRDFLGWLLWAMGSNFNLFLLSLFTTVPTPLRSSQNPTFFLKNSCRFIFSFPAATEAEVISLDCRPPLWWWRSLPIYPSPKFCTELLFPWPKKVWPINGAPKCMSIRMVWACLRLSVGTWNFCRRCVVFCCFWV